MQCDKLAIQLHKRAQQSLLRERHTVSSVEQTQIEISGQQYRDFASNDYLGLKKHPKITESFIQAAKEYGIGSGASALITGYTEAHAETETHFANWLNTDKAILFNSGYQANIGIINALTQRSDHIYSDKLCHASLLDGILLSRAHHHRYQHNDTEHLRQLSQIHAPQLIVTESIFSMEGDIAPLTTLAEHAATSHSGLIIDDAHGIGVLGKSGRGAIEHFNLNQNNFSCVVLPLGKAFNAMGAIVAGKAPIIDAILQFSRSYTYTTAMPPAIGSAIQTALDVITQEQWRREQLIKNIEYFIGYAKTLGLPLLSYDNTPIKPIIIQPSDTILALQQHLKEKGFWVAAIRPPTVPKNTARLRISLNCLHTQTDMMQLLDTISTWIKQHA